MCYVTQILINILGDNFVSTVNYCIHKCYWSTLYTIMDGKIWISTGYSKTLNAF